MFWKSGKFDLIAAKSLNYNTFRPEVQIQPNQNESHYRYFHNNVALIILFKHKETQNLLAVSSSHFYWDPEFADNQIVQSVLLTNGIHQFLHDKSVLGLNTPVIFTGDLNSMPNSGVYEFLTTGSISKAHSSFGNGRLYPFKSDPKKHPLNFESAYSKLKEPITHYNPTSAFKATIDYIFLFKGQTSNCGNSRPSIQRTIAHQSRHSRFKLSIRPSSFNGDIRVQWKIRSQKSTS